MVIGAGQEKTTATVRSLVIWGEELSKKGRYVAAEKLYQRALGLVKRTLGQEHPITAEVLECYADLLVQTNRRDEGIAMKSRSEAIWKTYAPHYYYSCRTRTHIQVRPPPTYWVEREGSD